MVTLCCQVVADGGIVTISIDERQLVSGLKDAIKGATSNGIKCAASELTLYLAKRGGSTTGGWLSSAQKEGAEAIAALSSPRVPTKAREMYLKDDLKMNPTLHIGTYFDSQKPQTKQIHVLAVVLPASKKRKWSDKDMSLQWLWDFSEMNLTSLPLPENLASWLLRPFPFKLDLNDRYVAKKLSGTDDSDSPSVLCHDLVTTIDYFTKACPCGVAWNVSENPWQPLYDILFSLTEELCRAKGYGLRWMRNQVDSENPRPNYLCHYNGLVLLRGEEKSSGTGIEAACRELVAKMQVWNPMFYGDLPYAIGYVTSGSRLAIATIDRNLGVRVIAEVASITADKTEVISTFYNLAFVFAEMIKHSKTRPRSVLLPFERNINSKRTIEMMDEVVQRTILREQCRDDGDFDRLVDIYKTLRLKITENDRTCLQTVNMLHIEQDKLTVNLSPLGYSRSPWNPAEVREWLTCLLTALSYWHGCNYCHGDLCSRNIVYVPATDTTGYWLLIDMDESRRPNTATIDWNHPSKGSKLGFHHDLFQLGEMMDRFLFALSVGLEGIRDTLLSAEKNPELTAHGILAQLNGGME